MSSNFTVKWVLIFFACVKSRLSMGLQSRVLIISFLIHRFNSRCSSSLLYDLRRLPCATPNKLLRPGSPNPSTACNFSLLNANAKN